MVTATAPLGAGEFRASYGEREDSFLGKVNKVTGARLPLQPEQAHHDLRRLHL